MSQIIILNRGGKTCPHFLCDRCKAPIMAGEGGFANLTWPHDVPEGNACYTEILCKDCDDKTDTETGQKTSWMDLETAWWYLKNNSGFDANRAASNAQILSEL